MKRLRVRESITVQNAEAMVITDGLIATLHDDPAGRGVLVRYADREVLVPWANVRSFETTRDAGDARGVTPSTPQSGHQTAARTDDAPFTVKRGRR